MMDSQFMIAGGINLGGNRRGLVGPKQKASG